jgi:hypothetical protein
LPEGDRYRVDNRMDRRVILAAAAVTSCVRL